MDFFLRNFVRASLDVPSRLEEILFGLVMVLSVTLTAGLSVSSGPEGVREMLLAVIGCNIAWGIIDALMYVMGSITARSRDALVLGDIRGAPDPEAAAAIAREEIGARMGPLVTPRVRDMLAADVVEAAGRVDLRPGRITRDDVRGAVACFLLVFVSSLPAALPFLVFKDPTTGLRVSNAILIAMLFAAGQLWAAYTGTNRIAAGAFAVGLGLAMVAIAILLGG